MTTLIALLIMCPTPNIENHTTEWTAVDKATLEKAIKRCGEIFPDAPCVKRFIKKEDQIYNVVCGGKNEISSFESTTVN